MIRTPNDPLKNQSAELKEHSKSETQADPQDRLKAYLKARIQSADQNAMSFYEYMQACLYHPQFGYYMQQRPKIGKAGDYYTSVSVHPVFAETIARFVANACKQWGKPVALCEMGAGTGSFARSFLDAIKTHDSAAYDEMTYFIIEKSPYHRGLQTDALAEHGDHVSWLSDLSELDGFEGIFFSNELVDAFPVHVVEKQNGQLYEVFVTLDEAGDTFKETLLPLGNRGSNRDILNYLERYELTVSDGQRLEVPLDAEQWATEVSRRMASGLWLTIDYGYTHDELLAPHHRRGTILCYDHHHVDDKPLERPGQKDITAHVHFEPIITRAQSNGWQNVRLCHQHEFLLSAGILDLLREHQARDPFLDETAKKNRAIRQLITPEGMSAAFRVLVLAKGVPETVTALCRPFSFLDMQ